MKYFVIIAVLLLLTNCQKSQLVKTHGMSFLEKRQKNLIINQTNKNDALKTLGSPSTKGTFENTVWIYIENAHSRGKILKLGQSVLIRNNVLVLKFNNRGILQKKEFYDKSKMNKLKISSDTTEKLNRESDFIYSFMSSIRNKMYPNKKIK